MKHGYFCFVIELVPDKKTAIYPRSLILSFAVYHTLSEFCNCFRLYFFKIFCPNIIYGSIFVATTHYALWLPFFVFKAEISGFYLSFTLSSRKSVSVILFLQIFNVLISYGLKQTLNFLPE